MSPNARGSQNIQNIDYLLRSGLAGGVAGCIAKSVVAPLDRVKILFQASNPDFQKYAGTWSGVFRAGKQIYTENGLRGLLQGHSATLLRVFPYAAIKFMAYEQVRYILMPTRESETGIRRFAAGSISGTISVFFTYPLELTRVRLAFQTRARTNEKPTLPFRPGLKTAISDIYHEGLRFKQNNPSSAISPIFARFPILSFYRGFTVTIVGMIPYAGTSFLVWDSLRSWFLPLGPNDKPTSTPVKDLCIGAISGAIGQTASYPLEIIRRRMQVGGLTQPDRWLGYGETIKSIWSVRGWRGFFVGLSIGYLKIVPMTAVSFMIWERGKRALNI